MASNLLAMASPPALPDPSPSQAVTAPTGGNHLAHPVQIRDQGSSEDVSIPHLCHSSKMVGSMTCVKTQ